MSQPSLFSKVILCLAVMASLGFASLRAQEPGESNQLSVVSNQVGTATWSTNAGALMPAVGPAGEEDFETLVKRLLVQAVVKYPKIAMVIFAMGLLRLLLKPAFAYWHKKVLETESKEDDAVYEKVERSWWMGIIWFLLDLTASVRPPSFKKTNL